MKNVKHLLIITAFIITAFKTDATEIHKATRNRDAGQLRNLLKNLPAEAVNATIARDITALHMAAAMNSREMASILIAGGATIDSRTSNGFTPLHWAAGKDAVEAAELLIRMDADVNAKARQGITPLHWAAGNNATNVINLLIEHGADMTATTATGFCPLHWATQKHAEGAEILLAFKMVNENLTPAPPLGITIDPALIGQTILTGDGDSDLKAGEQEQTSLILQPFRTPIKGSHMTVPLGKGENIEFVWIEDMQMWFGKYEITNGQYKRFNPEHDSGFRYAFTLNGDKQPAVMVNWTQAKAFAGWLNENFMKNMPDGYVFRLPTESEWETAAKCGDRRIYPWGEAWPPKYGNYSDTTAKQSFPKDWQGLNDYTDNYAVTCPVSLSGKNEWDIYGLAGNVWEWCEDWYDTTRRYRSRRGACWDFDRKPSTRIDSRGFDRPDTRCPTVGFRLVAGSKLESD